MFYKPIDMYVPISVESLCKWAQRVDLSYLSCDKEVYMRNKQEIYFTDKHGLAYLAAFRKEIPEILEIMGYKEVASFRDIKIDDNAIKSLLESNTYQWRRKIAEQKRLSDARQEAKQIFDNLGKETFEIKCTIEYEEVMQEKVLDDGTIIRPALVIKEDGEVDEELVKEIVGTYVILNENTICICDEYARLFLIRGTIEEISSLVNEMSYHFMYMEAPEKLIELV